MSIKEIPEELKIIKTFELGNSEFILCEGKNADSKEIFAFAVKQTVYEFKIISSVYVDVAEQYANEILKAVEMFRRTRKKHKQFLEKDGGDSL